MPHMYILRCADGTYYVGSTRNLERRLSEHAADEGAIYAKHRRPVELVYAAEFARRDEAFYAEKEVQGWSRAKREALIAGRLQDLPALARSKKRDG